MPKHTALREQQETEITLAQLCGDSARMVRHWAVPAVGSPAPVPPSLIHGVVVPAASARLIEPLMNP